MKFPELLSVPVYPEVKVTFHNTSESRLMEGSVHGFCWEKEEPMNEGVTGDISLRKRERRDAKTHSGAGLRAPQRFANFPSKTIITQHSNTDTHQRIYFPMFLGLLFLGVCGLNQHFIWHHSPCLLSHRAKILQLTCNCGFWRKMSTFLVQFLGFMMH